MQGSAVMKVLQIGLDEAEKYLNLQNTNNLLKTVLPSRAEYIEKHGMSVHHYLLDEIEQLLLMELRNIQDGQTDDQQNAIRVAEIHKEVMKVSNEIAEMQAHT